MEADHQICVMLSKILISLNKQYTQPYLYINKYSLVHDSNLYSVHF